MYQVIANKAHFVVVSKNPEVSFHNEGEQPGLVTELKKDLKIELYPVHRLDKVTSGLILFAKTSQVAKELSELFSSRKVEKTYLALSELRPSKKQGSVKGDILPARDGAYKLSRSLNNPSMTTFKAKSLKDSLRLFVLHPKTGKTHQLRVVMKSLGSPILGDMKYKGSQSDRIYLHCYELKFILKGLEHHFKSYPNHGNYFEEFKSEIIKIIEE